jgi:prophage antirepressor-like protein
LDTVEGGAIFEAGIYSLVMRSDKREAKDFLHWVTAVVLPANRKEGIIPDVFLRKVCEHIHI